MKMFIKMYAAVTIFNLFPLEVAKKWQHLYGTIFHLLQSWYIHTAWEWDQDR